jgi:outer membrane scaffolding protein for murein synthesis (MipA/OmpV family)
MRPWPIAAFAPALLVAVPAAAQQGDWIVTVGAGASAGPPYEGSPTTRIYPTLSFTARRADRPFRFTPPDDGGSLNLFASKHFDIGPVLNIRQGRGDSGKLDGFKKIGWAAETGVFANLWVTDWLRGRVQVRQGIIGHYGAVGDAGIDYIHTGKRWDFSIGPRIGYGDARYMETYFGITPAEALASPYLTKPYTPGAGVRYAGAEVAYAYQANSHIRATIGVGYHHLTGVAADSPVVSIAGSRNQFSAGVGVSYSFGIHLGHHH